MRTVRSKFTVLTAAAALALLSLSLPGCRPDDTINGNDDSTTVFIDEVPDTLTGVWNTDTLDTYTDMLILHQDNLDDVFFEFDSYELSTAALDILMEDASYIMETDGYRVLIEGHCDERGTIDYNLSLGEKRAMAVHEYLVNYGIDEDRLEYISYGKERPFDPGHNEQAWASNRRAHFRVLPGN
jgi:peptidoglycan-associated lipoprotein